MKKTITTLSLLLAFFSSFASGGLPETGRPEQKEDVLKIQAVKTDPSDVQSCTISQSAVLSFYGSKLEVSCTVTKSTCREASAEAVKCIRDIANQIRSIIR